jgi:hypothetical protein
MWLPFHALFMLIAFIGIVLLIAWMIKHLKPQQLLLWSIVLSVVGLLGCCITLHFCMNSFREVNLGQPNSSMFQNNIDTSNWGMLRNNNKIQWPVQNPSTSQTQQK